MLCVAHARVGVLRRSWWAVWDGERAARGHARARVRRSSARSAGTPIEVDHRAGVDAQDAAARDRHRARARAIDLPGPARRVGRAATRGAPRGAGRRERGGRVRRGRASGTSSRACTTAHPRSARCGSTARRTRSGAAVRRPGAASATCAFDALATRAKRENYLVIASDYEQPFGTFTGTLPVAGPLTGWGVMERHEALGEVASPRRRVATRGSPRRARARRRDRRGGRARPAGAGGGGRAGRRAAAARARRALVGRREGRGGRPRADARRARVAARAGRGLREGGAVRRAGGAAGGGRARVRAAAADARGGRRPPR